jgi:Flp pilus assembly protein TadG
MFRNTKFRKDESGSFGTIAALSLGVVLLGMGAAFDVAGSIGEKQNLQDTIDAALLASIRLPDMDEDAIEEMILEFVKSELGEDATVTLNMDDTSIDVTATSKYETKLLGLFGMNKLDVATVASVPRASQSPVDIALVVDTTDSMAGSNMTALRAAAIELINDLEDSNQDFRVSLVPYGHYVNIGMGDHSWLDNVKPPEIIDPAPTTSVPRICTPTGNINSVPQYTDGVLTGYNNVPEQSCVPDPDTPPVHNDPPPYQRTFEYEGCAGSRYSTGDNVRPGADASDPIKAAMEAIDDGVRQVWVHCGTEIIPLTDDFTRLRTAVSGLTTSGDTYIPAGLIWGWRVLDPQTPYQESASGIAKGHQRAIIFMTDGGNTLQQNWAYHADKGDKGAAGTAIAKQICTGIKDDGIRIFTVGYDIGDISGFSEDPNIMLSQCASTTGDSFSTSNAYELKQAFKNIGATLSEVRLSR